MSKASKNAQPALRSAKLKEPTAELVDSYAYSRLPRANFSDALDHLIMLGLKAEKFIVEEKREPMSAS